MQRSESISALAKALAAAMGTADNASKDATNPHFKRKYADLASVRDAIREPFAANGLSYPQFVSTRDGGRFAGSSVDEKGNETATDDFLTIVTVETVLIHESGEWMSCACDFPIWNADPQKIGSAITYGRRYSLQAVTGVAPEEDDGNAASGRTEASQQRQEPRRTPQVPQQQTQRAQYNQGAQQANQAAQETPRKPDSVPPANPVTEEQKVQMRELYAKLGIENATGANQLVGDLMQCSLKDINSFDKAKMLIAKLTHKVATNG